MHSRAIFLFTISDTKNRMVLISTIVRYDERDMPGRGINIVIERDQPLVINFFIPPNLITSHLTRFSITFSAPFTYNPLDSKRMLPR